MVTELRTQDASIRASNFKTPVSHFRLKSVWVVIAIAVVCLGVGVVWWRINQVVVLNYVTVAATRGDIVRTVTTTGTINPELTIMVGTYVSGVLQDLYCDFNTKVKMGQICAKIDPRPYQSIVDQAKATLGVAKAQLEKDRASRTYAQLNYDRNVRTPQAEIPFPGTQPTSPRTIWIKPRLRSISTRR